jgi:hypothetical protein
MATENFNRVVSTNIDKQQEIERLVDQIRELGKEKGYDVQESPLTVFIGTKKAYTQHPGQPPEIRADLRIEKISSLLEAAINDPQSIKGSVRISIGKQEVYTIKNGEVKTDHLSLSSFRKESNFAASEADITTVEASPSAKEEASVESMDEVKNEISLPLEAPITPQQEIPTVEAESAAPIVSVAPVADHTVAALTHEPELKSLTALEDEIARLGEQVTKLTSRLERLERLDAKAAAPSPMQKTGQSVLNWLDMTRDKIVTSGRVFVEHVTQNGREIAATALTNGMRAALSTVGEKLPDGSIVLESKQLNQRLFVSADNQFQVKERTKLTPQDLWDKYSAQLEMNATQNSLIPSKRQPNSATEFAQAVATRAFKDGHTKGEVLSMIRSADPQYKAMVAGTKQGRPEPYARLIVDSAARAVTNENKPKAAIQQSDVQTLSRGRAR